LLEWEPQVSELVNSLGSPLSILQKHNINIYGSGPKTIVFAHGYGCDQTMWRYVAPDFQDRYRVVLFDYVGAGKSDLSQYSRQRYATLHGYAEDVLAIIEAVSAAPAIFVGHSVSALIGVLASLKRPAFFESLVLVGPSPCYINHGGYIGGFSPADIEGLLSTLDDNHMGWSKAMAPVIMKNEDRPELAQELSESFCRTDPKIARHFARVTFLSDNRSDLCKVTVPSLIMQCSQDDIAPETVGEFVHRNTPSSKFVKLEATGHCPHLSAPAETIRVIRSYVERR
jgi:sigma-B regulation protein RsbQ